MKLKEILYKAICDQFYCQIKLRDQEYQPVNFTSDEPLEVEVIIRRQARSKRHSKTA